MTGSILGAHAPTDVLLGVARLGHGVGSRKDLPVPFWMALAGAVVALVVSFVALLVLWKKPRLTGASAGRPVAPALARVLDAPATATAARVLGLLLTVYFLLALLLGPDDALNPSAGVVYVLFWVGLLVLASALLGPVWRALNPLRTLHLWVNRMLVRDPDQGVRPLPRSLGLWPAALAAWSFGWLELVAPDRATTAVLRVYLAAYALWVLGGAAVYGARWISTADAFEVISGLYGRLSALGRRSDTTWVWRSPLDGMASVPVGPGVAAVVCVLLGTTAYDGLSASPWWIGWVQGSALPAEVVGTLALLAVTGVVGATYTLATWWSGSLSGVRGLAARMPRELAHSVVPIALGYAVAHYWSLFVVVGQQTLARLSDPLGTGADWLGTAEREVNYLLVGPTTVATIQVVAVVGGHVLGVILAHDRTVALVPGDRAVRAQLPVLALMVFFTLAGLALLFSV